MKKTDYLFVAIRSPKIQIVPFQKGAKQACGLDLMLEFPAYDGPYVYHMFRDGGNYGDNIYKYCFIKKKSLFLAYDRVSGRLIQAWSVNTKALLPKLALFEDVEFGLGFSRDKGATL